MRILLNSDFLFALFSASDAHHQKAKQLLSKYLQRGNFYTLNLVLQESATVINHKLGQKAALEFLAKFNKLPVTIIRLSPEIEKKAWEIFKQQNKKGTSFVDCANLAIIDSWRIKKILSFDKFYPKKI